MGACVSVTSSVCSTKAKAFEFNERSLDRGSSLCSRRLSLVAHVPRARALVFLAFPSSLVFFERRPRLTRLASPRLNGSRKRAAAAAAAQQQRHSAKT